MNTSSSTSQNNHAPANRHVFTPTALFVRYLKLSRALNRDQNGDIESEAQRAETAKQCEAVAQDILKKPSQSVHAIFEKLYIWRAECFCASENGYIYSDDQYPLSAYFDLMDIVGAQYLLRPDDEILLKQMQRADHNRATPMSTPANQVDKH